MKTKLLLALLLANVFVLGQTNETLVDTTKLWSNLMQSSLAGPPPYIKITTFVRFSGDTLIGSHHFKKVLETTDNILLNFTTSGFIREDAEKKVYYRRIQDTNDRLLYDFDVEVGDTVNVNGYMPLQLKVEAIDSVLINDKYHKRFSLSGGFQIEQWIEGIGSLCGVLSSGAYFLMGMKYDLLCYYENDSLRYSNPEYAECYYNTVGILNPEPNRIRVSLSPNPLTSPSLLKIECAQHNDFEFQIYSANGLNVKSIIIRGNHATLHRSDFAPGLYIYRLIAPGRGVVSGKFVVE